MLVFSLLALFAPSRILAQINAAQHEAPKSLPVFEVVSVKQNRSITSPFRLRFTTDGVLVQNASLLMIVRAAYGLFNSLDDKFIGVPGWARTEKFDIEAKVNAADIPLFQTLDFDHRQQMVQALLADRFKLQAHLELRVQPVYALVISKDGLKLQPTASSETFTPGGTLTRSQGHIEAKNIVLSQLVSALTQALGRTVQDKTALTGKYDLTLRWNSDEQQGLPNPPGGGEHADSSDTGPSIFTAVQEQLGLRLQPAKASVDCLVIEHIAMPTPN